MRTYLRIPAKYRSDPRRYFVRVHLDGAWRCFCAVERLWVANRIAAYLREESFPDHDVQIKRRRTLLAEKGGWRNVAKALEQCLTDWDERHVEAIVMSAWDHPITDEHAEVREQVRDAFEAIEAHCRLMENASDEAVAKRLALPVWLITGARKDGVRTTLQRRHR